MRAVAADRNLQRLGFGRQEARLQPQEHPGKQGNRRQRMAEAVRQAERINLVAAVEHRVGKAGAAEEHADHRPRSPDSQRSAISSRATMCGLRSDWASATNRSSASIGSPCAPRSSAMRLVLPFGSTATGGGLVAEMAAIVDLGQRRLDGAVAAVDDQHLGPDARDGPQRVADLLGALDLIMEDVGMVGAIVADARQLRDIARRLGVRQQGDPRARSSSRGPDAVRTDGAKRDFGMIFVSRPL